MESLENTILIGSLLLAGCSFVTPVFANDTQSTTSANPKEMHTNLSFSLAKQSTIPKFERADDLASSVF